MGIKLQRNPIMLLQTAIALIHTLDEIIHKVNYVCLIIYFILLNQLIDVLANSYPLLNRPVK